MHVGGGGGPRGVPAGRQNSSRVHMDSAPAPRNPIAQVRRIPLLRPIRFRVANLLDRGILATCRLAAMFAKSPYDTPRLLRYKYLLSGHLAWRHCDVATGRFFGGRRRPISPTSAVVVGGCVRLRCGDIPNAAAWSYIFRRYAICHFLTDGDLEVDALPITLEAMAIATLTPHGVRRDYGRLGPPPSPFDCAAKSTSSPYYPIRAPPMRF